MWARIVSAALGVWLMAAPTVLDLGEPARSNDHVAGALAASLAMIAAAEVTRSLRWVALPLGVWLLTAPWLLGHDQTAAILNDSLVGVALAVLAPLGGRVRQRFGGGWSSLWSDRSDLEASGEQPLGA